MQHLIVCVEGSPLGSITRLFGIAVHGLPVQVKREVSALLTHEAEKIGEFADVQERLSWEADAAQLQAEQERDLQNPALFWWEPKLMSEAEYFDQLAQIHGRTEAVL